MSVNDRVVVVGSLACVVSDGSTAHANIYESTGDSPEFLKTLSYKDTIKDGTIVIVINDSKVHRNNFYALIVTSTGIYGWIWETKLLVMK